jgi:two-component sensor histidine kinase
VDAPELQISSDQAVPMAMIVTEAVSNAARYAFPGGRSGSIQVHLNVEGARARLVVADDGVGFPDEPADPNAAQGGIGIQLIRGFARQLGASLTVQKEAGTRYQVDMILRREPAAPKDVAFG